MRIQKLGLTFAVLVVALFLASGNALAKPGGATGTQTFTYFNAVGGNWVCHENRIVQTNARNPFTKESFTCTIDNLSTLPAGTYTFSQPGPIGGWASDFTGQIATSFTIVVTDNGNGTGTVQGVAYY
jgi:hypothetical protein